MVRHVARPLCARIFLLAALLLPSIAAALPGQLDATFGTNGVVRMDLGLPASARIEASVRQELQSPAKVVVAGTVQLASGEYGVLLGRFNVDGTLDGTYGSAGWTVVTNGMSEPTEVRGIALRSDDGVVVLLKSGARTGIAMRQADGSRYATFGMPPPDVQFDSYSESLGFDPHAITLSQYNYIYVAGSVPEDPANPRGRDSFGIVYQADGSGYPMASGRYSIGGGDDEIQAMVYANGFRYLAGRTREPGGNDDAFVAAVPDYFGQFVYSQLLIDHQGGNESVTVLRNDNGRLLVGGTTRDAAGIGRFMVAGVMAANIQNLMLDTTYGASGTAVLDVPTIFGPTGPVNYDATLKALASVGGYQWVVAGNARDPATGDSRFLAATLDSNGNMQPYGQIQGWAIGGFNDYATRDENLVGVHADYWWGGDLNVFGMHSAGGFQQVEIRRFRNYYFDDYYWPGIYNGLKLKAWQRPTADTVIGVARTADRTFVLGASDDDTVLARLRADGQFDDAYPYWPSIMRLAPSQFPYEPVGMALDSAGRIVIASDGGTGSFVASRFDGLYMQPDYGFGSGGNASASAGNATASAVAVAADDSIAVVGYYVGADSKTHPAVARVTAAGSADPAFNGGSTLLVGGVEMAPRAAAFTADGKLIVAGGIPNGAAVVAGFSADGSLEYTYTAPGNPSFTMSQFNSVAVGSDGIVYASGICRDWQNHYCAVGLDSTGSLADFGLQVVYLSGTDDDAVASGLTADGKLIVAGDSYHTSEFKAIALHADGSRDSQFAAPYGIAASGQYAVAMKGAIAADGTFVLAGETLDGDWLLVKWQSPADTVPAPFTFGSQSPVAMGQAIRSAAVTIDGTSAPAPIRSINNTPYSIGCTGSYTTADGTINSGTSVCVTVTSASQPGTTTTGGVFVGGVKGTFSVTTGTIADVTLVQVAPTLTNQAVATFGFQSSDATAQLQCGVDGAALGACASPFQTGSLVDGPHSFRVVAVSSGGMSAPAQYSWRVDTTPPLVVLDSSPPSLTSSTNASLAFHASDPDTIMFDCSVDGSAFAACTSPVSLSSLASASHTFDVRGTDPAGNQATAHAAWTVDAVAPDTTITSGPPALTNSTHFTFVFTSNDPTATFECDGSGTGTSYSPCVSPVDGDMPGLADGTYTTYIRAKDAAGNVDPTPAAWTFTLDRTPPETSLNYAPTGVTNQTTAAASFFSEAGATFECRIDGAAYAACTSPVSYSNLAEGAHSIDIRARDAAGNLDPTPSSSSWTIDRTAPDTSLTAGPSGTVAQSSGSFSFSSPDAGATFQCAIDGNSWFGCASPYPFYSLADGTHLFEVRAVDAAQNFDPSPASRTWTIDTTAPNTSITSGPNAVTPFTAASFTFTTPDGVSFQCSLDGAAYAGCTSPANFSNLANGSHSFAVFAVDAAGNADATPATWAWSVDNLAPDTTISSGPTGTVAQTGATLAFTSDDGAATFECRLDGAAFAACASPVNLAGLAQGAHTFDVRAKDAVGNVDATPASRSWTVDTVAPDTSITAAPPAATNSTSASFSFSASEGGSTFECKLDAGAYAACASPVSYSSLAVGSHTFSVRAKDAAGNTDATPATFTWIVDTTAPDTTITGGPSGGNNPNTATLTFTSTEAGSTFQCKLDAGAFVACTSPTTYTNLPKGSHTFQVRATDAAGNTDPTPATRTWTSK